MKISNVLILMALVATPFAGQALEDDGTPYAQIAKRIAPAPQGFIPKQNNAYDFWGSETIEKYLNDMDRKSDATGAKELKSNGSCSTFHEAYTNDRVIDIRYALGYFDDARGIPNEYAGLDWGLAASTDEGISVAIRKVLTGPCPRGERRLCGFTELTSERDREYSGETVLVRQMEVQGRSVEVRMTLTYASASPFYKRNKTELRTKQERFTRTSDDNFFGGIRKADWVFYMGHARNGGGPDFNPPRLTSAGKPDYYGYYRKAFPGLTRMMSELKASSNKDVLMGIFACDSKLHFHRRLSAQNKNQRMILTLGGEGMLHYLDTLMVSLGYIEGLLRGSCGSQLDDFARVNAREKAAYQQYNVK